MQGVFTKIFFIGLLSFFINLSNTAQNSDSEYQRLDSISRKLNNEGVDFAIEGNLEKASKLFLQSLKIVERIPNYNKSDLALGYINLANTKQEMGYADSALYYYEIANGFLNQVQNPKKSDLAVLFVEMGDCNLLFNDFQNSITLIKKGIALYESDSLVDSYRLTLAYLKLGIAYHLSNKYDDAITYFNKSLSIAEIGPINLIKSIYINLGNTCTKKGDFNSAIKYYKESEKLYKKTAEKGNSKLYRVYGNLGFTYFKAGDFSNAEKYYKLALDNYHLFNFKNGPVISRIYNNLGYLKIETNSLDESFRYFELSIESNYYGDWGNDITKIDKEKLFSISIAESSFEGIGDVYLKKSQTLSNPYFAKKSVDAYKIAISLVEDMRFDLNNEDDKFIVSDKYKQIFGKAINAAYEYSKTDKRYIDEAFQLSSKSKATILHEMIAHLKNGRFSGVPEDILTREKELKTRLNGLAEKLYDEFKKTSPNNKTIKNLEDLIFETQKVNNDLISKIKKDYPNYYSLKFDTSYVTINQVQKVLTSKKIIIEFVKTDSMLLSFAITHDTVLFLENKINKEFYEQLFIFKNELIPTNITQLTTDNAKRFAQSSNYLYKIIIKPFEPLIANKSIVIIPSGELTSLPFNTLVRFLPDTIKGFYDLPYLVLTNPISFSLSSKIFLDQAKAPQLFFMSSLSVAPEYTKMDTSDSFDGRIYRQNLTELPGAKLEAESISKLFNGKMLLGKYVTEKEFKRIAPKYSLLHLAMHTYINNDNPNYSKLIFAAIQDSSDDGLLNAYEIYDLDLKSRLTILSACRSADGNLIGGEGIISIARGFNYSGCPSLLATQWKIDDESGTELIMGFAKGIKNGLGVAKSLQNAQIDFIANADPLRSHPYFWAAYQVYGSDNPVMFSSRFRWLVYLLLVCFISIGAYSVIIKMKKVK